ncbi:MAG: hypothetical protein IJ083_02460 [Clostridia bacterium]|nr:hypothetical protein [Clostridia bacterium]
MSNVHILKCPACGNALEYSPGQKGLQCPYCSYTVSPEEMAAFVQQSESQMGEQDNTSSHSGLRAYHCQNCGAEIVTGATTAATRCYYCHSPVVLQDRVSDAFRPDAVIPFAKSREEALNIFREYVGKKRFLDRNFLTDDQLEVFSGVYYPYWIGDVEGNVDFSGEGTRVHTRTFGDTIETVTRFFSVQRSAHFNFPSLQRKALQAQNKQLSDGIQPYRLEWAVPYSDAYLSGFLAERRDIEKEGPQQEMVREAQGYASNMIEQPGTFQALRGSSSFSGVKTSLRYILLPVWMLTYKGRKPDKPYYFLMNGQTGTICGRLPLDRKKLGLVSGICGALVAALLCLGGAFIW